MRKKKKGEIGKAKRKKRGRERSGRKERERERGEDKNNKKDVWVGNPPNAPSDYLCARRCLVILFSLILPYFCKFSTVTICYFHNQNNMIFFFLKTVKERKSTMLHPYQSKKEMDPENICRQGELK